MSDLTRDPLPHNPHLAPSEYEPMNEEENRAFLEARRLVDQAMRLEPWEIGDIKNALYFAHCELQWHRRRLEQERKP